MKEIGTLLKEIRKSKGLLQTWVAGQAGISNRYLSAIETGAKDPTIKTLSRVISILKVEPSEFFEKLAEKLKQ